MPSGYSQASASCESSEYASCARVNGVIDGPLASGAIQRREPVLPVIDATPPSPPAELKRLKPKSVILIMGRGQPTISVDEEAGLNSPASSSTVLFEIPPPPPPPPTSDVSAPTHAVPSHPVAPPRAPLLPLLLLLPPPPSLLLLLLPPPTTPPPPSTPWTTSPTHAQKRSALCVVPNRHPDC